MADVPTDDGDTTGTVTDDYFEQEYAVSAATAGEFLVELGEQLQSGDGDVTITGDDWDLPFAYREPVELELSAAGEESPPSLG